MDTDIDNYSNNEILNLLKLNNDDKLSSDLVFQRVSKTINKLTASKDDIDNFEEVIAFFRSCFVRVCVFKGWDISEDMRAGLNLEPLARIEEKIETRPDEKDIYVDKVLYRGSLPPGIPTFTAVNTHNLEYSRGDVNPVDRESITTILSINSKFRPEYNERHIITQGDRISDIVKCRGNPHVQQKVYDTLNCNNNSTGGYIGDTSDFTIELKEPFKDVIAMKLSGIEMMNGYYAINPTNGSNVFTITTFDYASNANLTCPILNMGNPTIANINQTSMQIGQGTYNISQLVTTINVILSQTTNPIAMQAIRANYNTLNGRLRFLVYPPNTTTVSPPIPATVAPPTGRDFGFNLDFRYPEDPERNLYYNLGWQMGFRKAYYDYCKDYIDSANTTLILLEGYNAEAAVNLIGTTYFLLEVNDFNNNNPSVLNYNCDTEHSFNIRNILAKIPNAVATNELLFEDSADRIFKTRKYFGPVRIKKLRIRLLDEFGRAIDLTNGDITVNLEITTLNSPYKNITY